MSAVWMRARAEMRGRWRAMVVLSLLLGVMAGGAIAAAAGARRTETAYPRFLERYHAYDITVTVGGDPRLSRDQRQEAAGRNFAAIEELPQVRSASRGSLFFGTVRTEAGMEVAFPDVFLVAEWTRDVLHGSAKVVRGRLSDPTKVNEAMVNYAMAERLNIEAGDTVVVTLSGESGPAPETQSNITVTGVTAMLGLFESATGGGFPTTFHMTPAFKDRWSAFLSVGDDNAQVTLHRGEADVDAFTRELERRKISIADAPQRASKETPGIQALNRVPATALWLLCGFVAVTTFAVFWQLLGRETWSFAQESPALRALGLSRRHLVGVSMVRSGIVAAGGALLSVLVAILLSPLTPVGLARIVEPDPGFAIDPMTLVLGALATFVLVALGASFSAYAAARWAGEPNRNRVSDESLFADRVARVAAGPSVQSGVRFALQSGRGDRAVPVRTALLGTTIAVGALAAALTFAGSLRYLIAEPRLAGYSWDVGAIPAALDPEGQRRLVASIDASVRKRIPGVTLWHGTVFSVARVDGIAVTGFASDGPQASIIEGRAPRSDDEVALDRRTLKQARKNIGDRVAVGSLEDGPGSPPEPTVEMRVVGTFAVPRIAFQGENPGQGAAFTQAGHQRMNPGGDFVEAVYARFPAGMDFERGLSEFRAAAGADAFAIVSRQQSATVGNVSRLSSLPIVLAVTMGLLGIATLAHALSTTIRRRRRDLAILKTIGFVGRQVRATVAWQATTLLVVSLAIGLPVGIAGGRWAWRQLAEQLQVVPVPKISALAIGGVIAGGIMLANLIAAIPGRAAARTEPAVVLRSE